MIGKMMLPIILTVLMMNSMFLFLVELPSDVQAINTYGTENEFGVGSTGTLTSISTGLVEDVEALKVSAEQQADAWASDEPSIIPEPLKGIIYGASTAVSQAGMALNLAQFFVKWLFLAAFGFILWIDILLPPALGSGVAAIGMGLKAILAIIIAKGMADILLPLFTGWRGN